MKKDGTKSVNERFQTVRPLGRGGFGEVFLVRDRETQQQFAMKKLIDVTPENRERFEREAVHLQRQLDNRHVVNLIEADLDADPPYLLLEYCEGGSLDGFLRERQRWQFVARVLMHTLIGLRDVHRVNGFHRDIKPHNLLLARDPVDVWIVKVADFGFARVPMTVGPMTRGAAGTPGYIAPEVRMGEPFHPGADMYSLGIVALELLTMTRDPAALATTDAPAPFVSLVRRMAARDMSLRPRVDEALATLLNLLGPSEPPQDGPRPPGPKVGPKSPPSEGGPTSPPPAAANAEKSSLGTAILTGLGVGAAVLAVAALLRGDEKTWDENVQRYRDRDGRFVP